VVDSASERGLGLDEFFRDLGIPEAIGTLTGDAVLEIGPGSGLLPDGAWLIGTDDEAGMQRFVDGVADWAIGALGHPISGGVQLKRETYRGVEISFLEIAHPGLLSVGIQPAFAVSDGLAVVASSLDEAKAVLDARATGAILASGDRFQTARAEAPGSEAAMLYVDVEAVGRAIRSALTGEGLAEFDRNVVPDLTPVKAYILGVAADPNRSTVRMFVLIG
jgi:hypothetical protein